MGHNESLIARTRELLHADQLMVFYDPIRHDINSGCSLVGMPSVTLQANLRSIRETRIALTNGFSSTTPIKLAFAFMATIGIAGISPAYRAGAEAWTSFSNVQTAEQNFKQVSPSFQPFVKDSCLRHIYESAIHKHGAAYQPNQPDQILSRGISIPALTVSSATLIDDFQTCVSKQSTAMAEQYIFDNKKQALKNAALGSLEIVPLTVAAGGLWDAFSRRRKKKTAKEILDLTENAVRLALEENYKHKNMKLG